MNNNLQRLSIGLVLLLVLYPAASLATTTTLPAETCGNNSVETGEECDDGDTLWAVGEACRGDCTLLGCGDPNDSRTITASDASHILDVEAELATCDLCVCDVDDDGDIDSDDANLVLQVAVGQPASLLTCPPPCTDVVFGCPASPATVENGCTAAAQAKLDVNEKKAGKEKMKLQWKKLADVTAQGDFGDPVGGTTVVALCVYDDASTLVQENVVERAGEQCADKDCWKAKGTKGYGYKDKDNSSDGVSKIGYGSGDAGKGKADAGGKNNASKSQTSLPTGVVAKLTANTAPTIQIVTSDDFCATATMNQVKKDEATRYSAQLK